MKDRYRDWYRGFDIVVRPRRYGYGPAAVLRWEAYLSEEPDGYPGDFLAFAYTRVEAFDAAHDVIDRRHPDAPW